MRSSRCCEEVIVVIKMISFYVVIVKVVGGMLVVIGDFTCRVQYARKKKTQYRSMKFDLEIGKVQCSSTHYSVI